MLRRRFILISIIIVCVFCMYGCGTVQEASDDNGDSEKRLLSITQTIDATKVAIKADLDGNYVVTEFSGACEANSIIEIGVDSTGIITTHATIRADNSGSFSYRYLPSDSMYIYLYAQAPGKRRSAPIFLRNEVTIPLNS